MGDQTHGSPDFPDQLVNAYQNGQLIAIVGSGFTSNTSPSSPGKSWVEFLRMAAQTLLEHDNEFSQNREIIDNLIDAAINQEDPGNLLQAASMIRRKFEKEDPQYFTNFLTKVFGGMKAESTNLGAAIKKLEIPVATTNYDKLLEKALHTDNSSTWSDMNGQMNILRGESPGVAHLHGVWDRPESLVLSAEDYAKLTDSEAKMFTESGAFSAKTFIFIGMGSGVLDPNFSHVVEYIKRTFGSTTHTHYVLCRKSELSGMESKLKSSIIRPLEYGETYDDLAPFLQRLAGENRAARRQTEERGILINAGWNRIAEEIRSNRLSGEEHIKAENILTAIVEPIFLPLSHEQFVHEKKDLEENNRTISRDRLKPLTDKQVLNGRRISMVVGEEHSGLTTSLQWLSLRYSQENPGVIPIYVDIRSIRSKERLGGVVRGAINSLGATLKRSDILPKIVVALDNVMYRDNERFRQFCNDILSLGAEKIFLGCQLGQESEIANLLGLGGSDFQTCYLGRIGKSEVNKYAIIIAPGISAHLVDRVLVLITREHLPRNPFTVSLVLALFLQATSRPDILKSQTDVLNEYMKLLLGYAGNNLDSRETLSVSNLELVLIALAKEFVRRRTGALPSSDCVHILQTLFNDFDWIENPVAWLETLTRMRVLNSEGSQYSFRQSSYLYLYAAKAGVADGDFMQVIQENPLYFAPVVKHCAALQRNNASLIRTTTALLSEWQQFEHRGSVYIRTNKSSAPVELLESTPENDLSDTSSRSTDDIPGDDGSDDSGENQEPVEGREEEVMYDLTMDRDDVPFPFDDLDYMPPASKLSVAVELASNVLRESDAVSFKEVKDQALLAVLHSWGVLIDLIETDETIHDGARRIVEDGVGRGYYSREVADKLLPSVSRQYACFFVLSGIAANLRSRKLEPALGRLYGESFDDEFEDFYAISGAAFFELLSQHSGWVDNLRRLVDLLGDRWISLGFIGTCVRLSYVFDRHKDREMRDLKKILKANIDAKYSFSSKKQRDLAIDQDVKRLDNIRLMEQTRRALGGGVNT